MAFGRDFHGRTDTWRPNGKLDLRSDTTRFGYETLNLRLHPGFYTVYWSVFNRIFFSLTLICIYCSGFLCDDFLPSAWKWCRLDRGLVSFFWAHHTTMLSIFIFPSHFVLPSKGIKLLAVFCGRGVGFISVKKKRNTKFSRHRDFISRLGCSCYLILILILVLIDFLQTLKLDRLELM